MEMGNSRGLTLRLNTSVILSKTSVKGTVNIFTTTEDGLTEVNGVTISNTELGTSEVS
jgi:hypothetical protein